MTSKVAMILIAKKTCSSNKTDWQPVCMVAMPIQWNLLHVPEPNSKQLARNVVMKKAILEDCCYEDVYLVFSYVEGVAMQ